MDIYGEKHFMNNRDLEKYGRRQAQSCLYLIDLLGAYYEHYGSKIWDDLATVHEKQYEMISEAFEISKSTPANSYYFRYMYEGIKPSNEIERLAIHYVSYLRGIERYSEIISNNCNPAALEKKWFLLWPYLYGDAKDNSELCRSKIFAHYCTSSCFKITPSSLVSCFRFMKLINSTIRTERKIIKRIDRRNKAKQ